MTQVPVNRSQPITATSTATGILGIFFSNSFVDEVVDELRAKCPTGKISGVYTKQENRFYFLVITRTVTANAYCETNPSVAGL